MSSPICQPPPLRSFAVYHVVLRKGGDVRVLNFWAGAELPVAQR